MALSWNTMEDLQAMLRSVDEKIAALSRLREAIAQAIGVMGPDGLTLPAASKKGHVSEAARLRLKEEMRLRWAWRKAGSAKEKKEAKEALERYIAENRPQKG